MAENRVLDPSAWLALDEAEPDATDVEAMLAAAWLGEIQVFACFVTLTELDTIRTREHDAQQAAELLTFARAQRGTSIHSDDALCATAAKLKAAHRLSFADAFVAALAVQLEATLVHQDPKFSALARVVQQHVLPLQCASAPHLSLRLYMDVHVPQGITDALRAPNVSVVTAQEDDHAEADDSILLARATASHRVLFTRGRDFLEICAAWQREAKFFSGVVDAHQLRATMGRCVQDLALIAEVGMPDDLANRVEHLPL